jgi:hypothetical protein
VISPDGRFLYVGCSGTHDVHGFRIGPHGELHPVPHSPFLANNTPDGMAFTPDGQRLFVSSVATQPQLVPGEVGLWTFTVNDDGSLTTVGRRLDAAGGGGGAIVAPGGRHLLVTDFFDNNVAAYETDTLRQLPGSPQPSNGLAPSLNSVATLPNLGPRASFTARSHANLVTFDAVTSTDEDGRIARYHWNFGDGTTLADGGLRPSHTYRQPGTYRATLTGYTPLCVGSTAARTAQPVRIGTTPTVSVSEQPPLAVVGKAVDRSI